MQNGFGQSMKGLVGGVVGGALGTALIQKEISLSQKLPEPLKMPAMSKHPGEVVVQKVESLAKRTPSEMVHRRSVGAASWAYGIGWAGALGFFAPRLGVHTWQRAALAGAGLGTLVWAAGYVGWLPMAGIVPPVHRVRPTRSLTSLLAHVTYGVVATIPVYAMMRAFPKRRGWLGFFK